MYQLPKSLDAVHQAEKRMSDPYDDRPLTPDDVVDEVVRAFLNRREAVQCQLKILDGLIEVTPSDIRWCHAGSLGYVERKLKQAILFLSGPGDDA